VEAHLAVHFDMRGGIVLEADVLLQPLQRRVETGLHIWPMQPNGVAEHSQHLLRDRTRAVSPAVS
jgi:hypothetical protein